MPISVISSLNNNCIVPQQAENISSLSCTLQWRMGKLLVKTSGKLPQPYLVSLENEQSLIECLTRSSATLVSIDPKIGASLLKVWADACQKANKPIFMSLAGYRKLPKKDHQIFRILPRIIDWTLALFLLVFMSPFVLAVLIIMQIYSSDWLFNYEWYVGEKCQLFRVIKFNSNTSCTSWNLTNLHISMGRYCLENYFNLLNVLQGKIYLIGRNYLSLEDAISLNLEKQNKVIKSLRINAKNKLPTT